MIEEIIKITVFFLLPANILLNFIFKKEKAGLELPIALLFSYGVGPLLGSLIFRYSVFLFPNEGGGFYLLIFLLFWFFIFIFSFSRINSLFFIYKKVFHFFYNLITKKRILISLPFVFFFLIFSIQCLFYPIVSGDSAYYINQGEAIFEYRNIDWEKEKSVLIRNNDEYVNNSMIRPAIPYFIALSNFLFKNRNNYFTFHFFGWYYYVFLYFIFIMIIIELAKKLKKSIGNSIFFGTCFFVFSWGLTRIFILNDKETAIYFFALLGIYLIYNLSKENKKVFSLNAVMLSVIIGLNSFINPHGIIIGIFLLAILFLTSDLKIINRIKQILFIFICSLFFGGLEFFQNFFGMFMFFIKKIADFFNYEEKILTQKEVLNNFSTQNETKLIQTMHSEMFQIKNFVDIYLKGKLQIYTKIGIFGYGVWFFSVIVIFKLKEILKSKLGKRILFFIGMYFFIIIDPLSINNHPLAIILWGDDKYAKLILLVSFIFVAVYFQDILNYLFLIILKFKKIFFLLSFFTLLFSLYFNGWIKDSMLGFLFLTNPIFKNNNFYSHKIEIFFDCSVIFILFFCLVLFFIYFKKNKQAKLILTLSFVLFFIMVPFFIVEVGKVPLNKTFNYLILSSDLKMKYILNSDGKYDAYFYAKKILPQNISLYTNANELYIYDDYFKLTRNGDCNVLYEIEKECKKEWNELYSSRNFKLCGKT